jgi:hypothetical protein
MFFHFKQNAASPAHHTFEMRQPTAERSRNEMNTVSRLHPKPTDSPEADHAR